MTSAIIKLVSTTSVDIDAIAKQIKTIADSIQVKSRGPVPLPTQKAVAHDKEDAMRRRQPHLREVGDAGPQEAHNNRRERAGAKADNANQGA
jgi:hypothetical protein